MPRPPSMQTGGTQSSMDATCRGHNIYVKVSHSLVDGGAVLVRYAM